MSTSPSHPFDELAADFGLQMTAEALYSAPRDVVSPPAESVQHFLIMLRRSDDERGHVRLVFEAPLADSESPAVGAVLWWLAGDAWAVERAHGQLASWAAAHGYPVRDLSTARLFERHVRQAAALRALLGADGYERLVSHYSSDIVVPPSARASQ